MGNFYVYISVAGISTLVFLAALAFRIYLDSMVSNLCKDSKYKTEDYEIISGGFYCKSSDNSVQRLTKPKKTSKHLDEHKSDKPLKK